MKILWITNTLFPEVTEKLTGNGELRGSGGWMLASAEKLTCREDIKLYVATVSSLVQNLKIIEGEQITYYVLPYGRGNLKYNKEYESYWLQIKEKVKPEVVHIHGTEYCHGLAYIKACGNEHVIISVQGLKSGIATYYCAGLSYKDILQNLTFRDLLKGSLISDQKRFMLSGETIERPMLCKVNNIIGRTSWDKAHAWEINPKVKYHFCNETLRNEFYDGSKWNYDKCEKHTIFLSQAGYPLKGLHQVLRAMPLILHHYPNAKIKVAGNDITRFTSLRDKLCISGYGLFIRRMIHNMHLENRIEFLGALNAEQMKQSYLNCNVFICPSSIENSPNSLGEAQLLGVPHVASYVGGTADFMVGNEQNLYRFEEISMLAEKVCKIFANENKQTDMSTVALRRHNQEENAQQLMRIYNDILNQR